MHGEFIEHLIAEQLVCVKPLRQACSGIGSLSVRSHVVVPCSGVRLGQSPQHVLCAR